MDADPAPLVSVVIPAYNAAETIADAVDSALGQTITDIEVIVVDDHSGDSTAQAVEELLTRDPRVHLLRLSSNGGVAAARNAGIARSRGRWVAFLDSDDLWVKRKLEVQLEAMISRAGEGQAAQSSAYLVDEHLTPRELQRCAPVPDQLATFLRLQNLPAIASTLVLSRALLDELGGFDTELAFHEDWDFTLRIARRTELVCVEEPLTLYRKHPNNRTHDIDGHVPSGLEVLRRTFADPDLPSRLRAQQPAIYARYYLMLCGAMFRARRWRGCAWWAFKALRTDPSTLLYMAAVPLRRRRHSVSLSERQIDIS